MKKKIELTVDKKIELTVHLIFSASIYIRVKVQQMPRVGQPGESVAEITRFGWVLMSPRKKAETDVCKDFLNDYENLKNKQQILYVIIVLYIKILRIN